MSDPVFLPAGYQELMVKNVGADAFDLNWYVLQPSANPVNNIVMEAENYNWVTPGVFRKASGTGWTGAGYVKFDAVSGQNQLLAWDIDVTGNEGNWNLNFTVSNGNTNTVQYLVWAEESQFAYYLDIPPTGNWANWTNVQVVVPITAAVRELYLYQVDMSQNGVRFDSLQLTK
jgi:hypothetical protein